MIKWLLKFLKVDKYIEDIVTGIIVSILTRLSEIDDEDFEKLEREINAFVYSETSKLPSGVREIARAAINPLLTALFAALEQVDDIARFVKRALERM